MPTLWRNSVAYCSFCVDFGKHVDCGDLVRYRWIVNHTVDFDRAEIKRGPVGSDLYLVVTGMTIGPQFEVILSPHSYLHRPEYWDIEVALIASSEPVDIQNTKGQQYDFSCWLPLDSFLGTKGVRLIGKTRAVELAVNCDQLADGLLAEFST